MSIDVEKETTTTTANPTADRVSQSTSTSRVATQGEVKDAQADRGSAWVWYVVGLIDLVLLLRFVFKLFGAKAIGFAYTIYQVSSPLTAPFRGIFPTPKSDGSTFDTAALVAIIVYILLAWVVARLLDLVARPVGSKKI